MGACFSETKPNITKKESNNLIIFQRSYTNKYYTNLLPQNKIVETENNYNPIPHFQKQRIEIFISLHNLPEFSLESYKAVVYINDKLLGETESQEGKNINFSTPFSYDYFYEASQNLKVEIMPSNKLKKYTELFDLQKIMRGKEKKEERPILINEAKDKINLIIICDNCLSLTYDLYQNYLFYDIQLVNIPDSEKKKLLFEFYTYRDKFFWRPLYQSETSIETINPKFKEFYLRKDFVNGNDLNTSIKFAIYEQDKGFVGEAQTSIKSLEESIHTYIYDNSKQKIGSIRVQPKEFRDLPQRELFESLKFFSTLAIDFTESNLEYTNCKSLHFIDPKDISILNPYQDAITNMDRLLIYFNSTNSIPFYSFGAIVPGGSHVDNCCDLYNFFADKDKFIGVSGLLQVYGEIVKSMKFSGPTCLSPLFEFILQSNFTQKNPYNYHIVWILIDGDIDDFEKVEQILIEKEAWRLGLSIIVCGVGNSKFELMNQFISDLNKSNRSFAHFHKLRDYEDKYEVFSEKISNCIFYDVKNYFKINNISVRRHTQFI